NAGNLLSDIKPGYMLGAKPRQQAIGHCIGILAGALAATPLFFLLFLPPGADGIRTPSTIVSDQFPMPSAMQWKGVADLIARGLSSLPTSAVISMAIAAGFAAFIEIATIVRRKPFPLSSVSIGLGVILPPDACFGMWIGALFFWWQSRRYKNPGTKGHRLWVEGMEPICAGLITGAALVGIGNALANVLL
ncbi:MAG TPA: OPT/YSL family transporter, partial [Chthoniobacterales bacterium]|nr:OPT/YSL family transporter [Chthoniobacterales bacterium]